MDLQIYISVIDQVHQKISSSVKVMYSISKSILSKVEKRDAYPDENVVLYHDGVITIETATSVPTYRTSRRHAHVEDEMRRDIENLKLEIRYAVIDEYNIL